MITCGICRKKIDSMAELGDHVGETGHEEYRTQDGVDLPRYMSTLLVAGAKWCIDCSEHFANNYRYYEHVVRTGHEQHGVSSHMKSQKMELDRLEKEWFFERPHIPYTREPLSGQDGNLMVWCPKCKQEYKSGYFMDTDFDLWKPNTQSWDMTCSLCGVTSEIPNQNIRLRHKVYEERVNQLQEQLRRYKEKYGNLEST